VVDRTHFVLGNAWLLSHFGGFVLAGDPWHNVFGALVRRFEGESWAAFRAAVVDDVVSGKLVQHISAFAARIDVDDAVGARVCLVVIVLVALEAKRILGRTSQSGRFGYVLSVDLTTC